MKLEPAHRLLLSRFGLVAQSCRLREQQRRSNRVKLSTLTVDVAHEHMSEHAHGHTRNTLLKDEELEMLVVLRMNRDFMKFMRTHYNDLTKDHFGRTVVDPDEE